MQRRRGHFWHGQFLLQEPPVRFRRAGSDYLPNFASGPPSSLFLKPSCPARHNSHRRCRKRRTARQDNCEEREEGSPSMARTAVVCLVQMCRASSSHGRVRTSKEEPRAGHGADATLMADETGDWIRSNLFFPPRLASLTGLDDPDVVHHHDRGARSYSSVRLALPAPAFALLQGSR